MKKTYRYYAVSNDRSFEYNSPEFNSFEICRATMLFQAINKMAWNTQLSDFDKDCNEIGYEVKFYKDMVTHSSYSGKYIFIVLDADNDIAKETLIARLVNINAITSISRPLLSKLGFWDLLAFYAGLQKFTIE